MRVLVVGGAGYIGSVVTRILTQQGVEAVVLDNLCSGHRESVPQSCRFVQGDMGNAGELDRVFETGFDAVMHFAAHSLVGESVENPAKYFDNNFSKSLVLFEAMRRHHVSTLIFSSTASVYGETNTTPITEAHPLNPTNPYGESKLAVENAMKWYSRAYPFRYASLRYFNAAGAYDTVGEDHSPETHLIPIALQVAAGQRDHLTIFGDQYPTPDGTCVRDYVHVADLADAHVKALRYLCDGGDSAVFNLGNGTGHSVKEVVAATERVTGRKVPVRMGPVRAGDPAVLVASSAKIARTLNWTAQSSLERMIGDAWKWKQQYPDGYAFSAALVSE